MKNYSKILFTGIPVLFFTCISYAQNSAWPCPACTTPVGIGTTAPPSKLSVIGGSLKTSGFSVNYLDVHTTIFNQPSTNSGVIQVYSGGNSSTIGSNAYALQLQPSGGNLGIGLGTSNPSFKLDVASTDASGIIANFSNTAYKLYFQAKATTFLNPITMTNDNGIFWSDGGPGASNTSSGFVIAPWSGSSSGIRIAANGNVGIGTNATNTCKLAVEGKIGAREVKVLNGPFPDYVFEKEYKRMSLTELEEYIYVNKHLPNVPSAKEVEEEHGINLGEMQLKQLEKTEELYLYVIEMNKKLELLTKENTALKASVEQLKNK
jgi:hypothetical protein